MNKAIIITLTNQYSTDIDFKNAIDNLNNCPYNTNNNLTRFLTARKEWNGKKTALSYREAYKELLKEECPCGMEKEDIRDLAIGKIMTNVFPNASLSPYAYFISRDKNWEVILVLCNRVGIERFEYVKPVDLFLDCICKDLEISPQNGKNVLYVHADQIGEGCDKLLVEENETRDRAINDDVAKCLSKYKKTFYRIACFTHNRGKEPASLFDNILANNFDGRTHIHDKWDEGNSFF